MAVPANCIGNDASGALKRAPGAEPTRAVKRESEECGLLLTKAYVRVSISTLNRTRMLWQQASAIDSAASAAGTEQEQTSGSQQLWIQPIGGRIWDTVVRWRVMVSWAASLPPERARLSITLSGGRGSA